MNEANSEAQLFSNSALASMAPFSLGLFIGLAGREVEVESASMSEE